MNLRKKNDLLLDRFEESIKSLKLEYDIFFNGAADRWPEKMHEALNFEAKRLMNIQSLDYAQRFRLNSLATRLSVYNDLWQRNLRMMEQGKKPAYGGRKEPDWATRRVEVPITSETDRESMEVLFQAFCRARERVGNTDPIDPMRFEEFVAKKVREIKQSKSAEEVVFIVAVEEGDVHLRTRINPKINQ